MLVRHTLVVFGAKVMAKVVARALVFRRISCESCYITCKTRVPVIRPMETSFCLLSPGPAGAKAVSQQSLWWCWTGAA